jgi:hypothetical protein
METAQPHLTSTYRHSRRQAEARLLGPIRRENEAFGRCVAALRRCEFRAPHPSIAFGVSQSCDAIRIFPVRFTRDSERRASN